MKKEFGLRLQYDHPLDVREFAKSLQNFAELWGVGCEKIESQKSLKLAGVERGSIILNFVVESLNTIDWFALIEDIAKGTFEFARFIDDIALVYKFAKKLQKFLKWSFEKVGVKKVEINKSGFNESNLDEISRILEEVECTKIRTTIKINDENTCVNQLTGKVHELHISRSTREKIIRNGGMVEAWECSYSVKTISWTEIKLINRSSW